MITNEITREEWIAELESGKYPQGTQSLVSTEDDNILYCCLGVYCKAIGLEENLVSYCFTLEDGMRSIYGELTGGVRPSWMNDHQHRMCQKLNDEYNWSFSRIAKWARDGMKVATEIHLGWGDPRTFCPVVEGIIYAMPTKRGDIEAIPFNSEIHKIVE